MEGAEALMHVPEENLFKYRVLMGISRNLESLGSTVSGMNGEEGMKDSTLLWAMAKRYRDRAQTLRVPGKTEISNRNNDRDSNNGTNT
jgi:hypothetical protein